VCTEYLEHRVFPNSMGRSSNRDANSRSAGYDTSLLAQNLDNYQRLYNKEPLVIILIHKNPVLKPRASFLLDPLNLLIAIAPRLSTCFLSLRYSEKFAQEQSLHIMEGRTCKIHGDIYVTVIISGISGGTTSNLGEDTACLDQVFSFFTLSSSS
jgi:hypothetical protein